MRPNISQAFDHLAGEVHALAGVSPRATILTDRARMMGLDEPGEWSANRSCRMIRAADGWLAVNLPRASDLDLLPAWVGCGFEDEPWSAIEASLARRAADEAMEAGQLLGLAVARVASVGEGTLPAPSYPLQGSRKRPVRPTVVDLSSLWAGPLCGMLLAKAGAEVIKVESRARPDGARATPGFFEQLNAGKAELSLDFAKEAGLAELRRLLEAADVVITSARPRAFEQLGLTPELIARANPGLIWVAITAYGWQGDWRCRVGFGDDAAAAGGLVNWVDGAPRFEGDAIADPLTGLAAAAVTFRALRTGESAFIDAALAKTAAGVVGLSREAAA